MALDLVKMHLQTFIDAGAGVDVAEEEAAATLVVTRHLQRGVAIPPVAIDGHGWWRAGFQTKILLRENSRSANAT